MDGVLSLLLLLVLVGFGWAGVALVRSGLRANREGRRIGREWERARGRIVEERVSTDDEGTVSRRVRVRYTANGGVYHVWDSGNLSPVGTAVEVLFDPRAPARAALAENARAGGRGLVVVGVAVLVLLLPFAVLLGRSVFRGDGAAVAPVVRSPR